MTKLMTTKSLVNHSEHPFIASLHNWSVTILMVAVWFSTLLFGLYILAFYFASYLTEPYKWNESLAGLHVPGGTVANSGIGLHFLAGGIILILGCVQLLPAIRQHLPRLHRISGRVYLLACLTTSIGGLIFIATRGTIGGRLMDIGFGLYGVLMFVCVVQTYRYARRQEFARHRAWALRLFALAVGSWLYRMEYGLWFMFTDAIGHQDDFRGWFDGVMAFFFFVPNLLVVELILRSQRVKSAVWIRGSLVGIFVGAGALVLAGTWAFWDLFWSEPILAFLQLN
jgi:uncharacterized membrane protein